jgi:hypothetical protein
MTTASVVFAHPEIWDIMLPYVGSHEWLFLGGVCKSWAALYAGQPLSCRLRKRQAASAAQQRSTSYGAAAASLRRTLWVCKTGAKESAKHSLLQLAKAAASQGSSNVLMWARAEAVEHWSDWGSDLCIAAIRGNQLATLQRLHSDAEVHFDVLYMARTAAGSRAADLTMLQWICSQKTGWVSNDLIALCAAAGAIAAIDKLDWLRTFVPGEHFHNNVCYAMIDAGAVVPLQWLIAHGMRFLDVQFTDRAMWRLQFAAVRHLVQQGCTWRAEVARLAAAAAADAQMLQWMREADQLPWTTEVLSVLLCIAGQTDNMPAARWLREQGAAWPASLLQRAVLTCTGEAARPLRDAALIQQYMVISEQQPVAVCWSQSAIQWALANGCPWGLWDSSLCIYVCSQLYTLHTPAAHQRITWAHAAGCPCSCKRTV